MTFDLSPQLEALRQRALRLAATKLGPAAEACDASGEVPRGLLDEIHAAGLLASDHDVLTRAITVQALAVGSAGIASAATFGVAPLPDRKSLPGLRGADLSQARGDTGRVLLAAVALGIGSAALEAALALLNESTPRPADEAEKPHWVVADAATELEAATLLTCQGAQSIDDGAEAAGSGAIAKLMATAAAERMVAAALRVAGPAGYRVGALLERLTRDARSLSLVHGGEDDLRGIAADALYGSAGD
jgi:hypothetical protein